MKGDFKEVTYGYCKCGCGNETTISVRNEKRRGHIKGEHIRFIPGHNSVSGKKSLAWKGGEIVSKVGYKNYLKIYMPEHQRNNRGYIFQHTLVVEKALGKSLPDGAVVHHIDGNGLNNKNSNLVICQDRAYHNLLHARQRRI